MPRDIFLLIKLEGVFSAHWAIYIPTHTNPSNGKLLHVSDVLEVEFVRNYNIPAADDPGKLLVLLGQIDDSNENSIYDTLGNSNSPFTKDQDPKDKIERLASGTVVPGSTHDSGSSIDCCQSWVCKFVNALMTDDIIPRNQHVKVQQMLDSARRD